MALIDLIYHLTKLLQNSAPHLVSIIIGGLATFLHTNGKYPTEDLDISSYAKEYPDREDIADTVLWWVAVRCKTDRISKKNYKKILKYIPNRLRYLDEQDYDLYPLICK